MPMPEIVDRGGGQQFRLFMTMSHFQKSLELLKVTRAFQILGCTQIPDPS